MTVILELRPEVEAQVRAQAAAQGMPVAAYLQSLIERAAAPASQPRPTLEEFETGMDALAEGSEQRPILPPDAYSRESIYANHA